MNIPFRLSDETVTGDFLTGASKAGLLGLSLCNACTEACVSELLEHMIEFATERS